MARYQTGRSSKNPRGHECSRPAVFEANEIMEVVVFLLIAAHASGCRFIVEQPESSLLNECEEVDTLYDVTAAVNVYTELGAVGAFSKKPLRLCGTAPWLAGLRRLCPRNSDAFEPLLTRGGMGGAVPKSRKDLHASQAYPFDFAKVVAKLNMNLLRR